MESSAKAGRAGRARLEDVAAAADTSKPIASRILNDDPTLSVSDELRHRVRDAAAELGYTPHAAARGLRRAQMGALGLLVPPLVNPVYRQLIRGAFACAAERDHTVLLAEDTEEQGAGELFARLVLAGRIDGLMVASARPDHPLLDLLADNPIPHVFVNRAVPGSGRNVLMDDQRSVEVALRHLVALGHARIGHIAGPLELEPAARRAGAFLDCARELGLERAPLVEADFLEAGGVEALGELLEREPSLTAVLTSTVSQAVGAVNAAWRAGIEVPAQLSIVGCADMPLSEYLIPPLTAVAMPLGELGAVSVEVLIDQIESGATGDVVLDQAPQLIVRGSSGPPRGGGTA